MDLEVGNEISVKVKNPLWEVRDRYFIYIPEFNFYKGVIVQQKRFAATQIGLTTDDSDFSVRILEKKHIVAINEQEINFKDLEEIKPISFKVTGSKGNVYTVVRDSAGTTCDCPGFTFRRNCKHITEMQLVAA